MLTLCPSIDCPQLPRPLLFQQQWRPGRTQIWKALQTAPPAISLGTRSTWKVLLRVRFNTKPSSAWTCETKSMRQLKLWWHVGTWNGNQRNPCTCQVKQKQNAQKRSLTLLGWNWEEYENIWKQELNWIHSRWNSTGCVPCVAPETKVKIGLILIHAIMLHLCYKQGCFHSREFSKKSIPS